MIALAPKTEVLYYVAATAHPLFEVVRGPVEDWEIT